MIERRYEEDLAQATKPGTVYRGQLLLRSNGFHKDPVPAEVHFLALPGAEPQQLQFAIKLPKAPDYQFVYKAKLSAELPLQLPLQPSDYGEPQLLGDLAVNPAHVSGKDDIGASMAGLLLIGARSGMTSHNLPLSVLNHRLEGIVGSTLVGNLVLDVQQDP